MSAMPIPPESAPAKPWYREPWPWLLMSGPGLVVIAGLATAWIAFSGADGLVADDYYKQGLGINRTIARDARAASLAIGGDVRVEAGKVRVALAANAARPERLTMRIAHPSRASEDRVVHLARVADGTWEAPLGAPLAPVAWRAIVETGDWRVSASVDPRRPGPAPLAPGVR